MSIRFILIIDLALWLAWFAYWAIAARGVKPAQWREPIREQWLHGLLALLGVALLAVRRPWPVFLWARFVPVGLFFPVIGVVITALGLGIAIAARVQLAGNWSAAVEIKQNHALIRGGLYRYVRHPIYSGILLAILGSAIAIGQWRGLLAFVLIVIALLIKSRHEERRLRDALPDYAAYAAETAALIPFLL
jgi:protein-S-isoprenylcysteine O-methyltransferase Ste14